MLHRRFCPVNPILLRLKRCYENISVQVSDTTMYDQKTTACSQKNQTNTYHSVSFLLFPFIAISARSKFSFTLNATILSAEIQKPTFRNGISKGFLSELCGSSCPLRPFFSTRRPQRTQRNSILKKSLKKGLRFL